jgi:hypothetical protein
VEDDAFYFFKVEKLTEKFAVKGECGREQIFDIWDENVVNVYKI